MKDTIMTQVVVNLSNLENIVGDISGKIETNKEVKNFLVGLKDTIEYTINKVGGFDIMNHLPATSRCSDDEDEVNHFVMAFMSERIEKEVWNYVSIHGYDDDVLRVIMKTIGESF